VLAPELPERLTAQLERARERGMLGPGPVETHLEHAEAMASAVDPDFRDRFLDLGSGAGVPGLILLGAWPQANGTLLDARRRRCSFLEATLQELGLDDRGTVACGRAEEYARRHAFRAQFDVVVARGFGPPATTAECGVGFLRGGGRLVVSEPPGEPDWTRWRADGLEELGLGGPEVHASDVARFVVLTAGGPPAERWPRRVGVPGRRPLW
jgi:16S rRNA (guanine527-N7)-methyltransferase